MTQRRIHGIAAMSLVAALALAGCSTGGTEPSENETGAGVLTVASIPNYQTSLPAAIEEFEKQNPDITVEVEFVEVAALHTQLRTQLAAGTAPDVFTAYPGNGTPTAMEVLVPEGYLMDLSDLALNERLPSGMDAVTKVDGKRYILPLTLGAIGGIYNDAALDEAGLTAPTTWSELLDFCVDARAAGKVAYAYGAQTGWQNQFPSFPLSASLVYGVDPDFDEKQGAGDVTFSDSAWVDVLDKVQEMQAAGCFQDSPLGTAYEGAVDMVAKGNALSMVSVTSTFAAVGAAAPEGTTFTFHAIPATDDPDETWISAGGSGGYAINAAAKNPVAAKKFLDFLASDETMAQIADLQGALPSIVSDAYTVPDALTEIIGYVDAGKIHPYNDQLWPNPKVATVLMEQVQLMIGGQASPEDVLAAMDAAYAEGE
ncbi:extracellular solute-binding protein [Leifsonia sp. H3M29-4]|uniref:ABC transporter substrate-binding protein n=1 Tax=Salinibacterium metalliresistens TaxID=3031321 RepID=UPI0023D99D0F|nr:extracellular solute-binding protein [Salinibacterium metalliresistens]MDF1478603.1 extracellular solute-binding protein [Salinibacterium metalliresistens]